MISVRPEAVPSQEDTNLRLWLNKGERKTLERIVLAKVQTAAVAGLTDALKCKGSPLKLEAGNVNLERAQRYQTFLDVLNEIAEQREPFQIVKMS